MDRCVHGLVNSVGEWIVEGLGEIDGERMISENMNVAKNW